MAQYAEQLTNAPKSSFWTGSKGGFQNVPIYEQGQSQGIDSALQQALQMLQGGQTPASQQTMNQFYTQTVPGLSERFASLGSGGSLRSSGFQGSLGAAGAGLGQALQAQNFQQALPLLQLGLTNKYQTAHIPGHQGFLQGLAGPALKPLLAGLTGGVLGGFIPGVGGAGGTLAGLLGGGGQGASSIIQALMSGG